jgi:hypothetical protein
MATKLEQAIMRNRGGSKLLAAIKRTIARGWRVLPGEPITSHEEKICCGLGALDLTCYDFQDAAANNGWSLPRAWAFAQGFDGSERLFDDPSEGVSTAIPSHHRAFALGQLVRHWVSLHQKKGLEA